MKTTTMIETTTYRCDDGSAPVDIEADSPEAAAKEYVSGGGWEPGSESQWVPVGVVELVGGEPESDGCSIYLVEIEAEEPECSHEQGHDWIHRSTVGHGGGVVSTESCGRCGVTRTTDTWYQEHSTGQVVPGDHVCYGDADEEWVDERKDPKLEEAREAGREAARQLTPEQEPLDGDAAYLADRTGGDWDDVLDILAEEEAQEAFVEGYEEIIG